MNNMIHDNFIKKIEQESPEFISLMNILSSFQEYADGHLIWRRGKKY